MSRLIDADALLQEFETENVAHNSDIWHITGIKAFIENAPTAFDKEKVVEQLDEASYLVKPRGRSSTDYADTVVDIGEAIDIVKKGGAE